MNKEFRMMKSVREYPQACRQIAQAGRKNNQSGLNEVENWSYRSYKSYGSMAFSCQKTLTILGQVRFDLFDLYDPSDYPGQKRIL